MSFQNGAGRLPAQQATASRGLQRADHWRDERGEQLVGLIPAILFPTPSGCPNKHTHTRARAHARAVASLHFSPPPDTPGPFTLPLCTGCSLCLQSPFPLHWAKYTSPSSPVQMPVLVGAQPHCPRHHHHAPPRPLQWAPLWLFLVTKLNPWVLFVLPPQRPHPV